MTSRKTTSADTAQCSTTSHDAATDALAMSQSDVAVLAETFRLLGDQSRLKILLQCMHGSVAVGTSPKRSTCRSLWSAITCGCCAVRASCAANAKPSTSSTASRTSTSARCCRTWRSTFPRTKPTTDQAQAPRRMAGCEAPVPTPPVSLKDVLDAAWAQHPESRALPGAGMPRRHSNGRRQLGRLSLPRSQSPTRPTGSTAQRHS